MDLFEKIRNSVSPLGQYSEDAHGYYVFPKLEGPISNKMIFNEKEVLTWSINNYLGLANHPEVRKVDAEAAKAAEAAEAAEAAADKTKRASDATKAAALAKAAKNAAA